MRKITTLLTVLCAVVFAETFVFLGLDLTGQVIPFLGVGFRSGDDSILASFGVLHDFSNDVWGFEQSIRYLHSFSNFEIGLALSVIGTTDEEDFLYLIGPGVGYSMNTGFGKLDLGLSGMMTLPIGVTSEFEGPIPFLNLIWRFYTLP